jgi:hypothetical protein
MKPHHRVIEVFQQRLTTAVSRSPLLKATISQTSRLLDCSRLRIVSEDLPVTLLDAVIKGQKALSIDLRLRASKASPATVASGAGKANSEQEDDLAVDEAREKELQQLYHLLDHRIRRHGEQAKRQTGIHTLWLGYPLLYRPVGQGVAATWLMAPVFLWPVAVVPDDRRMGRVSIGRDLLAGPPQFNRVMASWIRRQFQLNLKIPSEESLYELDWAAIKHNLGALSNQFDDPLEIDCSGPLEAIPSAATSFRRPTSRRSMSSGKPVKGPAW